MKDLNANTYVKYILKTSKSIGRVKWWKTKLSCKAKDFEVGSKNANILIAAVQVKTKSSFSPSYLNFNTEQLQSVGFFFHGIIQRKWNINKCTLYHYCIKRFFLLTLHDSKVTAYFLMSQSFHNFSSSHDW